MIDLAPEVLMRIAFFLPKDVQARLIGDSLVGHLCCNQVFKKIRLVQVEGTVPRAVDFIDVVEPDSHGNVLDDITVVVEAPCELRAKYPYFVPNEIFFPDWASYKDYCLRYRKDIEKFKKVTISYVYGVDTFEDISEWGVSVDNLVCASFQANAEGIIQQLPNLEVLEGDVTQDILDKLHNLKSLRMHDYLDFCDTSLTSLEVLSCTNYDHYLIPPTIESLKVSPAPASELIFEFPNLRELGLQFLSYSAVLDLLDSEVPATLEKLTIAVGDNPTELDLAKSPTPLELPSLNFMAIDGLHASTLKYVSCPNLKTAMIHHLNEVLDLGIWPKLETLYLNNSQLAHPTTVPLTLKVMQLQSVEAEFLDLSQLEHLVDFTFLALVNPAAISQSTEVKLPSTVKKMMTDVQDIEFPEELERLDFSLKQESLPKSLTHHQKIKSLRIRYGQTPIEWGSILSQFPGCLQSLSVEGYSKVDDGVVLDFTKFKQLETLNLSNLGLKNDSFKLPASVARLDVALNQITQVPQAENLAYLNISNNPIDLSSLGIPPKLRALEWQSMTSERKDPIVLDLTDSPLEYLDLSYSRARHSKIDIKVPSTLKFLAILGVEESLIHVDTGLCPKAVVGRDAGYW